MTVKDMTELAAKLQAFKLHLGERGVPRTHVDRVESVLATIRLLEQVTDG